MATDYKREYEYLKQQEEDRKWREQQQRDREYREREAARLARKEEYEESLTWAEDWPDAFHKGIIRFQREANDEAACRAKYGEDEFNDTYFTDTLEEARYAQTLYFEEQKSAADQIAELEKQIDAIKAAALKRAGERVKEKYPKGFIGQALEDDTPNMLTNW